MKYTPETVDRICQFLKAGNTRKTSAIASGITEETFYQWVKNHPEFSESIKRAEEEAVARNVAIINKAAQETWQAAAWWLERRRKEDFAKMDKVDVTTNGKDINRISEADINQEIYRLLAITGTAEIVDDAPDEATVLGLVQQNEAEPL